MRRCLRQEDRKRKLAERTPKETDDGAPSSSRAEDEMMDTSEHSKEVAGPAQVPSQASSSPRLRDEDRKRRLEQSRLREVKNCKVDFRDGDLKRKREGGEDEEEEYEDDTRSRRDRTMVGEFEANQEGDDTDEGDGFGDFWKEVCDDRTGEVLDAKLTTNAENEDMAYMERLGGRSRVNRG